MTNRTCKACQCDLPLDAFHSVVTNGVEYHRRVCRKCVNTKLRQKYDQNEDGIADQRRAAAALQHVKNPQAHYKRNIEYWRRHPKKAACAQAVKAAVKSGKLTKLPCSVCGSKKSQAHHDDYDKPLDVIWFCHRHHGARHRELNRASQTTTTQLLI
jgi:hypothetical protein